ncbi:alkylglycerol monooxygenase-like isoform X2 [Halichondria panicea]|uniref:alkylglycerol monooxygenase-like isoform X2 n=1 Tax=Halichondria panicea TaxID=6063 RepID=UPI00312B4B28
MNSTAVLKVAKGFFPLFYLVSPSQSSFKHLSEVPDYVQQVVPYFFVLIALEAVVRWFQDKPLPRVNDSISSLTAGTFLMFGRAIIGTFEIVIYAWIYENFYFYPLPWDSAATWWIAMILIDFFYYWFHRMAHEINLFWAAHQVHHSSQDYTLSTALRQSVMQRFSSWMFYLPMAFFMPPAMYVVHKQFNLLYQFWIHTEVVNKLGPLEWFLNTPSHHRVHHGTNPYCIDKNYAGVLIIWDRMFGTFAEEKEKVYYGLMHQPKTWNPIYAQFFVFAHIIRRVWSHKGITEKLRFLFYSPSWTPGHGRMGFVYSEPYPPVSDCTVYTTHIVYVQECLSFSKWRMQPWELTTPLINVYPHI